MNKPLPVDPALPQLQTAWDAERMLDVFRAQLSSRAERRIEIQNCRLARFRYRKGLRSTVLYELDLCELASGAKRTQWVTGTTHAVKNVRGMYKKLLAANADRPGFTARSQLTLDPISYVPELNLVLQAFPWDRHLTTLPDVMESLPAEFEASIRQEFGSGNWRVVRQQVVPTRYRPALGVTLGCTVEAERAGSRSRQTRRFYVKLYRNDDGRRAYDRLNRINQQCARDAPAFRPVRPIAYLSESRALILEASPGESLHDVLIRGGDVRSAAATAATALSSFHHSQLKDRRRRGPAAMLQRAERAGKFIAWACPSQRAVVNAIIERLKGELRNWDLQLPSHLDVKPEHVFIHGDRAVFIDWDSFAMSDPVFDVASLLVRLKIAPDLFPVSKDLTDTASSVLATEYFRHVPSTWTKRLSVNYAMAAMKAAVEFIQQQKSDRDDKVAHILEDAHAGSYCSYVLGSAITPTRKVMT